MGYIGKVKVGNDTHLVASTLFGTCNTAADDSKKVVNLAAFNTLELGVTIHVKFENSNTATNPTLNVNSTGEKSIKRYGDTAPGTSSTTSWYANSVISFTYVDNYWRMNDFKYDTNTKNTAGSTDISSKIFLIGATEQSANPQTYSDNQVYVTNGSLYLTKTTDAEGTADNKPALLIGNPTGTHLELDGNEVMAKSSATATGPLYLNLNGGLVQTKNLQVGGETDSGTLTLYTYINGAFISGKLTQPYNGIGGTITHSLPLIGGDLFGSGNVSAGAGITINTSGNRYTIESKNKIYLSKTYTSFDSDIDDDSFRNCEYFKIYYKDSNNCNYNCTTMCMNTDIFPASSATSYISGGIFTLSCIGDVNKTYLRTATFHFETKSGGGVWKLVFDSSFLWNPSAATGSSITWTSTKQTSYSNSYIKIIKLEYFLKDT